MMSAMIRSVLISRAARAHGGLPSPSASARRRYRLRLGLTAVGALSLLAVVLGLRLSAPGWRSHETSLLNAAGIMPIIPPKPVPRIAFSDGEGRPLSLADFKGRAVLLNFWATWCVPCRREMPALDRRQAKLGGRIFQVLAISVDRQGIAAVQAFYRGLGLRSLGINLDASGKALAALTLEGIPVTLLIDRDGREIGRKLGALEWDSAAVVDAIRQSLALTEQPR
jgi:thiol-disulfide isomerase/thioredoxin